MTRSTSGSRLAGSAPAKDTEIRGLWDARLTIDILRRHYRVDGWWPGATKFEIMAGAILCQHANWNRVRIALDNLRAEGLLDPETMARADRVRVERAATPAGAFRRKSGTLIELAMRLTDSGHSAPRLPNDDLRPWLLDIHGIGNETADAILLFAFGRTTMVVDAYYRRTLIRVTAKPSLTSLPYEHIQKLSMLPTDTAESLQGLYASTIEHGKNICGPRSPQCATCPIRRQCATGRQTL